MQHVPDIIEFVHSQQSFMVAVKCMVCVLSVNAYSY